MRHTVESVSPEDAARMLESVPEIQRKVSFRWVQVLKARMDDGIFSIMPSQIVFDTEGNLINGQHTLHAVIAHGNSIKLSITYGAPKDCFLHFDQGRRRSNADVLNIPRKKLEIASTIKKLFDSQADSPEFVKRVYDAFEPYISIFNRSNTNRKGITAKVRTGAVLAIASGTDSETVLSNYDRIVRDDIADLPTACRVLWKRAINGSLTSSGASDNTAPIILAYKAFHKDTMHLEKLYVGESDLTKIKSVVTSIAPNLFA